VCTVGMGRKRLSAVMGGWATGNLGSSMTGSAMMFSAELRRRRQSTGMSLAALAAAVHYSKGYLSKVETGAKPATIDLARRCDAALNAGGELARLVPPRVYAREPEIGGSENEVWLMAVNSDASGRFVPVSRRNALAIGAASVLSWEMAGSRPAVDPVAVTRFAALLDEMRKLGRTLHPAAVLPLVIAQSQVLRGLATAAKAPSHRALLLLAGRYAEYASWMAQEAGDDRGAFWLIDQAAHLADASGDTELQAYAWVRRAGVLLYRDDAAGVVESARRAGTLAAASPGTRMLAARREAQGHALAGSYSECMRALDTASALSRVDGDGDGDGWTPRLGSTSVPDHHALVTAWCLYDLGRPGESAEILDRVATAIPPDARRARARFGARRALAHVAAGEVDHGCAVAYEAVDATEATDSATVRLDLHRLSRSLSRWHSRPAVRELRARLAGGYRWRGGDSAAAASL
jgi:transcriptional regulator with XRE-family HTH domain